MAHTEPDHADEYFICYHCREGRHKNCVGVPCRCACDFPATGILLEARTDQLTRAVIALGNIAKGDLSAIDCAVMARICIQGLGDLPAAAWEHFENPPEGKGAYRLQMKREPK